VLQVALLIRSSKPWTAQGDARVTVSCGFRILLCPRLRVPATAGLFRPVILLPSEAILWDERRLSMVLAHESAHIIRRDWLWQLISQAACALHFFNPLAWIANRQLRRESEFACDDYVLGLGIEATAYAHTLLDIARTSRFQVANTVGMARSANVEGRLKSIVDGRKQRKWVSGRSLLSVLAATAVLIVPVAVLKAMPNVLVRILKLDGKTKVPHSDKPLAHIPWVPSKEVAPNVFMAQNGIAGLPGGFRVKLIAIAPVPDGDLWDSGNKTLPDGNFWKSAIINWQGNTFHRWNHGIAPNVPMYRNFYIEIESENDSSPAFTTDLVSPPRTTIEQKLNAIYWGGDDKLPEVPFAANDPGFTVIQAGFPARVQTGTFRVGFANSNWHVATDMRMPLEVTPNMIGKEDEGNGLQVDSCGVNLGADADLYYGVGRHYNHIPLVDHGPNLSPDVARTVLLFDANGQPIEVNSKPSFEGGDAFPNYHIPADKFCRIARAVLETTPYQWAEFRDLPMRPEYEKEEARRLNPGVHGTATGIAPGFTKRLANGVTVSIKAVTKATQDLQDWKFVGQPSWRADGQVLADGPTFQDFPRDVKVWGKDPLVHFEIQYDGPTKDANTFVEALGKVNPKFWLKDARPYSSPYLASLDTAYLPDAKVGGVRVAVANGPWKVVARQPIDMPELPPVLTDSDMRREDRTGFDVKLGDLATIVTLSDNKETKLIKQPLTNQAVRAVALMKSGAETVLRIGMSGANGLQIFPVPARHGESTEGYSHIIASQVKEIQIQARPFEWVEFDGIALEHK